MWNDKETDVDLLGHITIAQTVLEIIGDNHLRPLTLGIYGDWGAGKSTVLSLLQKEINTKSAAKEISAHTILFNGWLFQGYEDSKTALMETIVTELAKLQPRHKKVQKLAKSLLQRVNWLKVAKVSANALLTGVTGIPISPLLGVASTMIKKGNEILGKESEGDDAQPFEVGDKKKIIIDELANEGVFFEALSEEIGKDFDPFDIICHIAWDKQPLSRKDRAEQVKKRNYFTKYGEQAQKVYINPLCGLNS